MDVRRGRREGEEVGRIAKGGWEENEGERVKLLWCGRRYRDLSSYAPQVGMGGRHPAHARLDHSVVDISQFSGILGTGLCLST